MSNLAKDAVQECEALQSCGAIATILQPRTKDLGGFAVRRLLPTTQRKMVGPWVFFDHMGPADFAPGKGISVRPHPHIGIATVTYLFEGEILHRDSLGSVQVIRPGDINLMIAGRGIVHSERERAEALQRPRRLHGLQLWLALPENHEETAPEFHHYPDADIPGVKVNGVRVKVLMGAAYGCSSPVKTHAETLYVEAQLEAGQRLELPDAEERAVYVAQGLLQARDTEIPGYSMALVSNEKGVVVAAREHTRIVIVGGERFGKRYIDWNFVSSRKERIERARQDWKEGRFDTVPGDEVEFIPLPD